ncbi:myoD family inhibitor isoform X1 [Sander lucioperca]|uniref:myoD family inhibitor isoform X1 n=1 Tax=Sander lucioperca TaxID=283035 RepID=UPI001653BA76|nr:myoD family inhibitor isoform X1 [Sander lucioperca]
MDVTSHCNSSDITESGANKNPVRSECILSQPTANGTLPHHNPDPLPAEEAPPPLSDRSVDGDSSDDSVTDSSSTNDLSRLLPFQPASALRKQKGVDSSSVSPPPVCTPPPSSCTSPPPPPPPPPPSPPPSRGSACNRHNCSLPPPPHDHDHHHHYHRHHQRRHSTNQKRLSSTRSHASVKTDADHIKEVAGDDCCVHCLLACLFCEMLSMCSALGECLVCGVGGAGCCESAAGCCCCVEAAGEVACTEEACQAVLDCGILEDCCGSSDCLEVCLECCSICFPS